MDMPIRAEVYCRDGLCGHSTRVIIDPQTVQVTHIVVKELGFPHTEIIVPLDKVAASTPQRIDLTCSAHDLPQFQPLDEVEYIPWEQVTGEAQESMRELANEEALILPYMTSTAETLSLGDALIPVHHEMIPLGELSIERGAEVIAKDGRIGRVDDLELDAQDGHITHVTLLEGHLWGKKRVTIPVASIQRIEEDRIYLKLSKKEVEALPAVAQ